MSQRARIAAAGALGSVLLLLITWFAAFHVGVLERADGAIFRAFTGLQRPRVSHAASLIVHLCNPKPYVYLCAVPVLVALARRRFAVAVAICAILLGANVTTQLLKPLLAQPRDGLIADGISWVLAGILAERPLDRGDVVGAVRGAGGPRPAAAARGDARRGLRGRRRLLATDARCALAQ